MVSYKPSEETIPLPSARYEETPKVCHSQNSIFQQKNCLAPAQQHINRLDFS